ncbi:cation:proton antiporter [Fundicoccus culcitae]|uniref:Cation:proton antiporter n=1 Tax=Fundicoccus culcitae TaxID=2969821 RepID=A0ABY5P8F1_9LACT|nr:cation:proton antiporter [Fundicoccus culcitae]UUX35016.1 cation:proton antiporter [Fundicoccus culcitae]
MLASLALIMLLGIFTHLVCQKLKLPSLVGYLLLGIILGPSVLNLLDQSLINISADLRQIILIIILSRAGLSLDLDALRKVGRPAILMSFVPASFEIIGTIVFAPKILGLPVIDAAILGTVLGAVSPAVVVPAMLKLIKEKRGVDKGIPPLILAGASVDDIYCLVLFAAFLGLRQTGRFQASALLEIPLSIVAGVFIGGMMGFVLGLVFEKVSLTTGQQLLLMLSVSMAFVSFDNVSRLPFSGILAVMTMAMLIYRQVPGQAEHIARYYYQLWSVGELFLFVLVGASVDVAFAFTAGWRAVWLVFLVLAVRMVGVWVSLLGTGFGWKEKLFCMIAYLPKATVQAAIGSIPLSLGLASGEIILTLSVVAILITAPLGAVGIEWSYERLLDKAE